MPTQIKSGKNYAFGVLVKDSDVENPQFRFKEAVLPGDRLLEAGIETWEQFWIENPLDVKRPQTHTVFEVLQNDNKRTFKYITDGMFARPGAYKKKRKADTLSDGSEDTTAEETLPTPLSVYATPTAPINPISLPEINELIQHTLASQNEFATEQISLLRSIIADKDTYIGILQQNEKEKIDAATSMYIERIKELEGRVVTLTAENTRLTSDNAVLRSNVEKLEWQTKEAKKIEEKLQKDFDEATKVMNKGLSDGGGSGILDKLLDRPIDEVIRGIGLLKEMFTGNTTAPAQGAYSQEQLQQLYQQAMRYQQAGVPGAPQGGMPQGTMQPGGVPPGTPQGGMPQQGTAASPQNPGTPTGGQNAERPSYASVPLQTGTQLPQNGTQARPAQFANVQSM